MALDELPAAIRHARSTPDLVKEALKQLA